MNSRALYLRLLTYVRPYWRTFALSIFGMVIVAATEPAVPALFKPLLDGDFLKQGRDQLLWAPIALIGLYLIRGVAGYVSGVAMTWVAGKMVLDLRMAMVGKLLTMSAPFYDKQPSGTLLSKLTYDVTQVTSAATDALTVMVRDTLSIVGLLAWMIYIDWRLSLISLVVAPLIVVIVRLINKRLRKVARSLQASQGDMTHVADEVITGHRIIKIFGGQQYETTRFHQRANRVRSLQLKSKAAGAANAPLAQIVTVSGLAAIVYFASIQVQEGNLTVGDLVSFLAAMGLLFSPIKRLTSINEKLQRGLAAAESIFGLLDSSPEPDAGETRLGRAVGRVEFRDVGFIYPEAGRVALEGVSLVAEPGQTIALVGPSGGGKSTIASLIPRLYGPYTGEILLDGQEISALKLADLRSNIALVSQDIFLFNDTVGANIAYGANREVTRERIEEAARAAYAWEFIEQLPLGLDAQIGDRGVRLSGGQRQRLAIARALIKDAPLLILDEATAALDTESERQVQTALERLREGRTTLVIAHRLSTVRNADRIVVLERGKVIETGRHEELLAENGTYALLCRTQLDDG